MGQTSNSPGELIIGVALLVLLLWLYFLPAWLARKRQHNNLTALFVLNLLLGWTLLGWVAALIWALAEAPKVAVATPAPSSAPTEPRRPCPFCAEPILPAAAVCRFCSRELPSGWAGER